MNYNLDKNQFPPIRSWTDYLVYAVYLMITLTVFLYLSDSRADEVQVIQKTIVRTAKAEGIDPTLALAIAQVESKFNPQLIGSLGEVGVYQLRPEFHEISTSTDKNIQTAIRYLAKLKKQCRAYGDAYFVCFNYGPSKRLKYPHLFPYYKKVMIAKKQLINPDTRIATRD